jgi:hypothetical protein
MARYSIAICTGRFKTKGTIFFFLLNLTNISMFKNTLGWRKAWGQTHRRDWMVYIIGSGA